MFNDHFYHASIRKTISAFGTLFNDIKVVRKDGDGEVRQITRVPLAYGPRHKFLARLEDSPNFDGTGVAIKLPRMSFEITSLDYDSTSQINKLNKITKSNTSTDKKILYTNAPYRMGIQLSVIAKNQDDALQIVEQIMPYFQPEFTITIKEIPEMDVTGDIPIVLNSIILEDDYTGDYMTRRAIIYSLDFTARVRFYGPVSTQGFITKATIDINDSDTYGFIEELTADQSSGTLVEGIDLIDDDTYNG